MKGEDICGESCAGENGGDDGEVRNGWVWHHLVVDREGSILSVDLWLLLLILVRSRAPIGP